MLSGYELYVSAKNLTSTEEGQVYTKRGTGKFGGGTSYRTLVEDLVQVLWLRGCSKEKRRGSDEVPTGCR